MKPPFIFVKYKKKGLNPNHTAVWSNKLRKVTNYYRSSLSALRIEPFIEEAATSEKIIFIMKETTANLNYLRDLCEYYAYILHIKNAR